MDIQIRPLLKLSSIDAPPKFLQALQDAGKFVKKLRETETDIVSSAANRSGTDEEHRSLQAGLLYLALTEPDSRHSYCTDIVLTSRDNLTYVLSEMTRLVAETWPKMSQNVRGNAITLLSELIATRGATVEVLMLHLYRRMTTGDTSTSNLWLIESMVDILEKNKEWLAGTDRQPFILPLTVFTLLRLIPDHCASASTVTTTQSLRRRELVLVDELCRKHFDRCAQIGRDFIRLLHGVARLEPLDRLWNDILHNFPTLSSHFSSIADILEITTQQFYMQTLIPHEMEQWTRWMMKSVHCVQPVPVNRYQDFFQRRYFSTPESQTLRVCLLRYVVTYFYPDNDMLASTLIPRWNFICWILAQSTCPVVTANAKLALFYDWFFYRPNDCIMNLEPGLLAMVNHLAVRSQPIALTLVDFLIRIVNTYHPPLTDRMVSGVRAGLDEMIRRGVTKSLNPLLEMLQRTRPDLFRTFLQLLGLEHPVPSPSAPLSPALASDKVPQLPGESASTTGSATVTNTPTAGRLVPPVITSPSGSMKSKLVMLGGDNGPPTDPRLTRGHAASLASTVAPATTSLIATLAHEQTTGSCAGNSSGAVATCAAVPGQPRAPNLVPGGVSRQESSRTGAVAAAAAAALSSIRRSTGAHQPPSLLLAANSQPAPILVDDSHEDTELFEEAGTSKMNGLSLATTAAARLRRTANWSPPPDAQLSRIYPSSGHTDERLPATPESIELTIDNLRRRFQDYHVRYHYSVEPIDVNTYIDLLDGTVRSALEKFRDIALHVGLISSQANNVLSAPRDATPGDYSASPLPNGYPDQLPNSVRLRSASVLSDLCEAMEGLLQAVLTEDSFDDLEIAGRTAAVVCELLFTIFAERLMPAGAEWSEEHLEECLEFPIFVPLRQLGQMNPSDPKRELLLLLLTEMQTRQPRLGYHVIFFLKAAKLNDEKMTIYRDFCSSQENPHLRDSLYKDMQLLADDNRRLFAYLLPDVFTSFSSELTNDTGFMQLIVGSLDPHTCNTVISEIVRGHLNLFETNDLSPILKASLEWNSIEQFIFWQLINAHEIPTSSFLPLIRHIEPAKHPEACSNMILLLKLEKPSNELMRALLRRQAADDALSVTALHFWSCPDNQHLSTFSRILHSLLIAVDDDDKSRGQQGGTSSNRDTRDRRRGSSRHQLAPENRVDVQLILTHLDSIRKGCKNLSLLQDGEVQTALQVVASSPNVSLAVKDKFSDLLALVEDEPTPPPCDEKNSDHRLNASCTLNGGGILAEEKRKASAVGRPNSTATSSKGGHRLRNLDSRRAAAAERRYAPSSGGGGKRLARTSRSSAPANSGCASLVSSASSASESSSESGDEEDDGTEGKHPRKSLVVPLRSALAGTRTTKAGSTADGAADKRREKTSNASGQRERIRRKPGSVASSTGSRKQSSDEEEDDEDEKNLEILVLSDESGDEEQTRGANAANNSGDNDEEIIRPSKRRKTATRRFVFDE